MAVEKKAEDTRTFAERLAYVQKVLKAPKSKYNEFGDYNYRNLEDIFEGVKGLCEENGLLLIVTDKLVMESDWHYIEATARVYDSKRFPEIFIENKSYAREPLEKKKMDAAQVTGTSSSYARKYALNGLFLIDDTKDPDSNEYQRQTNNNVSGNQKSDTGAARVADGHITEAEAKILDNMALPNQKKWALARYKVKDFMELTKSQYAEFVAILKKREEKEHEAKSEDKQS